MSSPLEQIVIILVEPQSPGNIGMVCRAMANFGAAELRLVKPCQYLHPEAHKFAVFAKDLLGSARVFSSLAEALADLHAAVAATRRQGKLRGTPRPSSEIPSLLHTLPVGGKLGLVFGREDAGLTNEEVALCTHSAFISSALATGSLNLAQAVLVFLYELSRPTTAAPVRDVQDMPAQREMEAMFGHMEQILFNIAFLNPARPESRMTQLRQIFRRAELTSSELGLLRGMWDQIAWSLRDWRGRKRGED